MPEKKKPAKKTITKKPSPKVAPKKPGPKPKKK